jgi:hypothetical protein
MFQNNQYDSLGRVRLAFLAGNLPTLPEKRLMVLPTARLQTL